MAIEKGTESVVIMTEERTLRIQIDTPKGEDPTILITRETIRALESGEIISKTAAPSVSRTLSAVAKQEFKLPGDLTLTGAQVAGILSLVADAWRKEDMEAG